MQRCTEYAIYTRFRITRKSCENAVNCLFCVFIYSFPLSTTLYFKVSLNLSVFLFSTTVSCGLCSRITRADRSIDFYCTDTDVSRHGDYDDGYTAAIAMSRRRYWRNHASFSDDAHLGMSMFQPTITDRAQSKPALLRWPLTLRAISFIHRLLQMWNGERTMAHTGATSNYRLHRDPCKRS